MIQRTAYLLCLLVVLAAPSFAQDASREPLNDEEKVDLWTRVEDLTKELEELREDFAREKRARERDGILGDRELTIYGDLGVRWQYTKTDGAFNNQFAGANHRSRAEYLIRLGAAGFVFDSDKHRLKYDVRISSQGQGDYDPAALGSPTVAWRPLDPFGSTSEIVFDRWHVNHTYKRWLRVGGGRFGSIFKGSELIFDRDFGFTGIYGILDLGVVSKLYDAREIDDWTSNVDNSHGGVTHAQVRGAFYYLAQNNLGLPASNSRRPLGFSLQAPTKLWITQLGSSILLAPGYHYFQGEKEVARSVGTGNTFVTTSTLDADGLASSRYNIGEIYAQLTFFEDRIASLKLWAQASRNFGSEIGIDGNNDDAEALMIGLEWGALELRNQGDFRLSYGYQFIEANAVLPEFNSDVFNTNYTGHSVSLQVNIFPGLTGFGALYYGWRIDETLNGVGRAADGNPGGPSDDREMRIRVGVLARF